MKALITSIVGALMAISVAISPVQANQSQPTHTKGPIVPSQAGKPSNFGVSKNRFGDVVVNTNWGGYAVRNGPYTQVSGRWQVPAAKWGQTNSNPYGWEYNTLWIGIGGLNDPTLIQMGTETIVNQAGNTYQYVWYELYPAYSVLIPQAVAAGDIITSSIVCTANCTPGQTQTWVMTISDTTRHWTWSKTVQFASSMVSAEWVAESTYSGQWLPMNNFGQVNFDSAMANNQNPNLNYGLEFTIPPGQTAAPSPVVNGNAFSVCSGFQTYTPCSNGSIH